MRILPRKILIINIFGIGDVLFTTPLIRSLKTSFPGIFIGYVCSPRTADLLQNNPDVDQVIVCDRDEYNAALGRSKILAFRKMISFLKSIRKEKFDVSIDVSLNNFTSCAAWLGGIKLRIGFQYKNRSFCLNRKFPMKGYEGRHVVSYYLDLLEDLGVPKVSDGLHLAVDQGDTGWAEKFLDCQIGRLNGSPVIGIVPGGGASWGKEAAFKRWAPEKYAKLADKLIEKFSAVIILMGDRDDLRLCAQVAGMMSRRPVMACGQTTVSQFAALAAKCSLVIVNDGGPLHIAVAVGAQTASIFGPVDERVYGPYPQGNHLVIKKDVACRPCYRGFRMASCQHLSCLEQLTVEEVFERIQEKL